MKLPRVAVALILLLGCEGGVEAQEATTMWQNMCSGGAADISQMTCVTSQGIYREGGALLFGVELRVQKSNPGPLLRVISPLGLLLTKGLVVKVDGVEIAALAFERCAERGCEALAAVTPQMISALYAGKEIEIAFWQEAGMPQQIVVPLTNFANNFSKVYPN